MLFQAPNPGRIHAAPDPPNDCAPSAKRDCFHEYSDTGKAWGAEALALIDGANPESLPDMAFLDIGMWDGMNGFEVCCGLKAIRRQTAGGGRPAEAWARENV